MKHKMCFSATVLLCNIKAISNIRAYKQGMIDRIVSAGYTPDRKSFSLGRVKRVTMVGDAVVCYMCGE